MKSSLVAALAGILAIPAMAGPATAGSDEISFSFSNLNMTTHPNGYFHLADDGVVRSYDGNGTVIDYAQLTNAQIFQAINQHSVLANATAHFHEVFDGVSGFNVTDRKQIWDPPANLRRKPMPPTTPNPADEAAAALEERAISQCLNQLCVYMLWCTAQGCGGCTYYDSYIGPGGIPIGVCTI